MKAIVLCAGYATRLYPLTLDKPKSLLQIKGEPLLNFIIRKIEEIGEIEEIFIVTNDKFNPQFSEWLNENEKTFRKKIKIINDGTNSNDDRLGGIGDLDFAIKKENIDDNLLVVLGDNLFDSDLNGIVDFFREKNKNTVGVYELKNKEEAKKFGVLELKGDRIVSIEEKPENPKSTFISTGIYLFRREDVKKIGDYMKAPLPKDGPGYLVNYFLSFDEVNAFVLDGVWHDIGSKETYDNVNKTWKQN